MHTNPEEKNEDEILDKTLRPKRFKEYFGQEKTKNLDQKGLKSILVKRKQKRILIFY